MDSVDKEVCLHREEVCDNCEKKFHTTSERNCYTNICNNCFHSWEKGEPPEKQEKTEEDSLPCLHSEDVCLKKVETTVLPEKTISCKHPEDVCEKCLEKVEITYFPEKKCLKKVEISVCPKKGLKKVEKIYFPKKVQITEDSPQEYSFISHFIAGAASSSILVTSLAMLYKLAKMAL